VEHCGNTKRYKNVLVPAKTQIFQTIGAQMEQRSLWEHSSGKETTRTKTREPSGTIHSRRIHNHSTTGRE
jgi:hypothetical protein